MQRLRRAADLGRNRCHCRPARGVLARVIQNHPRTLIEVKFLRYRGQRALAKLIEEIAADASLYLSRTTDYDNIVAFIWDDCAQTEQHHELKSGIEQINGVSAAIILPRPSSMKRCALRK
jgi:hypothetical protein